VTARDAGVKRLMFAASSYGYGNRPVLPRVETQEPRLLLPFALTRFAGELYCRISTRVDGLEKVALCYFNVFGPRQNPDSPYTGAFSLFFAAYHRGAVPRICDDGEQSWHFVCVGNVVDATLRACTAPGTGGQLMNVGTGERRTLN
jgi:nucleoside-diphosphate-sugar epimerase